MPSDVMDIKECAEYLKIHPKSLSDLAHKKMIPGMKIKNKWRFAKGLIDEWITKESLKVHEEDKKVVPMKKTSLLYSY